MKKLLDGIVTPETSPIRLALILSVPFTLVFIVLLVFLIVIEKRSHGEDIVAGFIDRGRAYFDQIKVARYWNASHGGVYVEVTNTTQPNIYLEDHTREIVSLLGKQYTKINPAFMTRQMSEISEQVGRYKFRIISARPLNPLNKPDSWEEGMLMSFESGQKEGYAITDLNGNKMFRYIAPLYVDEPCLGCHLKQDYKLGDVRGGISISIPMEAALALNENTVSRIIAGYVAVGMLSIFFVFSTAMWFSRRLVEGMRSELEKQKLQAVVHLAVATAHELRQPMTIVIGCLEIIKAKTSDGESIEEETNVIIEQCLRMDDIIKKMLNITNTKTVKYSEDSEILDLHNSQ